MSAATYHDHDHEIEDDVHDPQTEAETAEAIWRVDNVELTTVGIDVGSATSHLIFSRLHLRRRAQGYSTRFVVVSRTVLYRSDILLTPYRPDGLIDAEALEAFFAGAYDAAGLRRDEIDAGAVILTGVALERANAPRIAQLFADEGGRFVCASAGHNLEALLAAHGSGSVARSADGEVVLNVDVGGGTTKFALCVDGQVAATTAIWGGARLVVVGADGRIERIEPALERLATALGIALAPGDALSETDRERLADGIATAIADTAAGSATAAAEVLAGELPATPRPDRIVLSGGVAEYAGGTAADGHVDLGPQLAAALVRRLSELEAPVESAPERIRATVIGASQFTLQLSGNTIHLSGTMELPVHNVPVVAIDVEDGEIDSTAVSDSLRRRAEQLDLSDRDEPIAVAVKWSGEPRYAQLRSLADGIAAAHRTSPRRDAALIMVLEADVGASIGSIMRDEIGVPGPVVAIDGIELADLDFVDIGEPIRPANVVPVVIKSLVFPHESAERPRILGSV